MELPSALRLAVLWRTGVVGQPEFSSSFDQPLTDPVGAHRVRLEPPQPDLERRIVDAVILQFDCPNGADPLNWPGTVPFFVVYQDEDADEAYDPTGPDWALGVLDPEWERVAAVFDLERFYSELSLEQGACVRWATDGGFSPFVTVRGLGGRLSVTTVPVSSYQVVLSPTDFAEGLLRCSSSGGDLLASSYSSTTKSSLMVRPELDIELCAGTESSCVVEKWTDEWMELSLSFRYAGYSSTSSCVRSGALDALWVTEAKMVCEDCRCSWDLSRRAWVVPSLDPPEGWPCGESLVFCPTEPESIEEYPASCQPMSGLGLQ